MLEINRHNPLYARILPHHYFRYTTYPFKLFILNGKNRLSQQRNDCQSS